MKIINKRKKRKEKKMGLALGKECGRQERRRNKSEGRTDRIGFRPRLSPKHPTVTTIHNPCFSRKIQICSINKTVHFECFILHTHI